MTLLHTQWAVTGSAISSEGYDLFFGNASWSLDTDLSPNAEVYHHCCRLWRPDNCIWSVEGLSKLSEEGGHRNRDGWELYDYTEFESAAVL